MKSFAFLSIAALVIMSAYANFSQEDVDSLAMKVRYLHGENRKLNAELAELKAEVEAAETDVCVDCTACVNDIMLAVEKCEDNTTMTIICIKDAVQATTQCATCLCDVLDWVFEDAPLCKDDAPAAAPALAFPTTRNSVQMAPVLRNAFITLGKKNAELKQEIAEIKRQQRDDELTGNACEQCFNCIEDIEIAVVDCENNATTTIECVEDALQATADCIECVCDFIDVFWGSGAGNCGATKLY